MRIEMHLMDAIDHRQIPAANLKDGESAPFKPITEWYDPGEEGLVERASETLGAVDHLIITDGAGRKKIFRRKNEVKATEYDS